MLEHIDVQAEIMVAIPSMCIKMLGSFYEILHHHRQHDSLSLTYPRLTKILMSPVKFKLVEIAHAHTYNYLYSVIMVTPHVLGLHYVAQLKMKRPCMCSHITFATSMQTLTLK